MRVTCDYCFTKGSSQRRSMDSLPARTPARSSHRTQDGMHVRMSGSLGGRRL